MSLALCREASCHEVFLLACVALANMSLIESTTCDFLLLNSTVSVLISATCRNVAHSLFAKDQACLCQLKLVWYLEIRYFTFRHPAAFPFKKTLIALDISILVYYIPYNNYYLCQRGYGFISRAGKCKIHFPLILACDALLPSHEFISSVDSVPTTGAVQCWMSDCDSACWKNWFDCV